MLHYQTKQAHLNRVDAKTVETRRDVLGTSFYTNDETDRHSEWTIALGVNDGWQYVQHTA
jgi:hypothetical protein